MIHKLSVYKNSLPKLNKSLNLNDLSSSAVHLEDLRKRGRPPTGKCAASFLKNN